MKHSILLVISLGLFLLSKSQNADNPKTVEKNKLIFMFCDGKSRMPAFAMKNCSKARIETVDYAATDYKLQKFTITVLYDSTKTYKTSINTGSDFTKETKAILNLLRPDDMIIVYGIAVINSKGDIIYAPDRNFIVY